jgi:hypothetical protein
MGTMDIDLPLSPDPQFLQADYKAAILTCENYELEVAFLFTFFFIIQ